MLSGRRGLSNDRVNVDFDDDGHDDDYDDLRNDDDETQYKQQA